eukprot:TRINITY_DN2177_c0_g1_i3.p1 TRINITY_DN2177_c0_g1~~TRINITY_DN2177_c0_g1_i3.p1  ORF type:complete len:174 (+),score=36.79 TRINITY_DN2177_c0_g1_i3:1-522(+)
MDAMQIHSQTESEGVRGEGARDYVFSYFTRGIDVVFDGQMHTAKKFVLHTNLPGHENFGCYVKCNFFIQVPPTASTSTWTSSPEDGWGESGGKDTGKERGKGEDGSIITADITWEEIQNILGRYNGPAIQTYGSQANPFGASSLFGFPHMVLEVTKATGCLACVTLFNNGIHH